MTAAAPDSFRDQLAEARRAPWVYSEANGWVYGPDPDHAGLRYPYVYAADPEQCRILVARLNADAAEVEARVQAAANQRAAEGGPLHCTYCGGSLTVNTEWTGLAYMQTQEPESIECGDCDATWEPDGTLRAPAKWVRYPDLYAAPDRAAALAQPAHGTEADRG